VIKEMNHDEAMALLGEQRVGRLGCCLDGEPYVVPVNYLLEGESLYVHSLPGRKVTTLRANPRACLQVDEVKDAYHWRSVIAFGCYDEVEGQEERERIMGALFKRLPQLTPVESQMTKGSSEAVVFRLVIEQVTGVIEDW
jgi:uncharacterized protein